MDLRKFLKIVPHTVNIGIFIYFVASLYVEGILNTKGVLISGFGILIGLLSSIYLEATGK